MKPVNVTAPGFLEKSRPHLPPEQIEDLRHTERLHLAHPEQPERFAELTNAVHVMEANSEPLNLTASDIAATRANQPLVRFLLPRAGGIVDPKALSAFPESLKASEQLGCVMVGIFPEPEDLWPRDEEDTDLAAESTAYLATRHRVAAREEGLEEAEFPNPRTLGRFLSMLTRRADTYKDCEWRQWAIEAAVDAEMMSVEVMPWEWDTELDLLKMIEDLMIQAGMRRLYHINTLSNIGTSIIRNACY